MVIFFSSCLTAQHQLPRASTISSLTMSKPSQPCVFKYVSTIVNLSYPSHALISNYLATASENLSIFRSVTSSQTSCVFISATIYKTSIIAGVTILHTLLLLLLSFCHKSLLTLASTHSTLPPPSCLPLLCTCYFGWYLKSSTIQLCYCTHFLPLCADLRCIHHFWKSFSISAHCLPHTMTPQTSIDWLDQIQSEKLV